MKKEIWEDVKGYEGLYQVSNCGRVKSLGRHRVGRDGVKKYYKERVIKLGNFNGYRNIALWKDNRKKIIKIHRLVYQAFCGELVKGLYIDHIDHDPSNNNVENLQQISHRENCSKDKWRHNCASNFVGVSRNGNGWRAEIMLNGENHHIGTFKTEEKAFNAYQMVLNNPNELDHFKKKETSKYRGVWRDGSKWRSAITLNGKKHHIGSFNIEGEASSAYQIILKDNTKINDYKEIQTSKCLGVSLEGGRWRSQIKINGEKYHIGLFKTELDAHEAYQSVLQDNSKLYDYRKR